jgi:hypothetical protein
VGDFIVVASPFFFLAFFLADFLVGDSSSSALLSALPLEFIFFIFFFFFWPFDLGDIIASSTTVGESALGLGGCCGDCGIDADVALVATVAVVDGGSADDVVVCLSLVFPSLLLLSCPPVLLPPSQPPLHPHPDFFADSVDDSIFISFFCYLL